MCSKCNNVTSVRTASGFSYTIVAMCCGSGCPGCPTFPGNQPLPKEEKKDESKANI